MSHMVETMAYAGQVPWHGLGVNVSEYLTVPEMVHEAGIGWTVRKVPTKYTVNGVDYPTGDMALIRETDNKILTTVGPNWEPFQNLEAFNGVLGEFIDQGLTVETAMSLKGGRLVCFLCKMNSQFVLFNDDLVEQYLLATNPHIYGQRFYVRNTPVRVVCNNTLTMALSKEAKFSASQSHHRPFDADSIKEAIGIANVQLDRYAEMARFLGSRRYNDKTVQDYFDRVFPNMSAKLGKEHSRNSSMAYAILESGEQPGAEFGKGTWWQPFNTVTYMSDHVLGKTQDKRLTSAWFGANANRKLQALELAVELAEAA